MADLDHLLVAGFTASQQFRSSLRVIPQPPPQRNRRQHGNKLLAQLRALALREQALQVRRGQAAFSADQGTAITLSLAAGVLDFSKLEWRRDGIEVLAVGEREGNDYVTLYVPAGKLGAFEKRVKEYLEKDNVPRPGQQPTPKNARLINTIHSIGRAVFEDLWTAYTEVPQDDQVRLFQVWLRTTEVGARQTVDAFCEGARKVGIEVIAGYIRFPGRLVVGVHARRSQLEEALELLDLIAEIRDAATTAEYFLSDLQPREQAEYIRDLIGRTHHADPANASYIVVLDTGVNSHPLLSSMLDDADKHAVANDWGLADHDGHGTQMAGIAGYGNLLEPLDSLDDVVLPHRLESVKILPPIGANPVHLYGWVTEKAAVRVEAVDEARRRTFAIAVTAYGETFGFPTEWSATIDRMAFGLPDTESTMDLPDSEIHPNRPRLFAISAGNIPWEEWGDYPTGNTLAMIEDPGQSWNALTVGACTDLIKLDAEKWPGYSPIGPLGGLSPCSRTSNRWKHDWPLKPDVVCEGGNGCREAGNPPPITVGPESLRIVTTSADFQRRSLTETGDTSAAMAEAARLSAHISARYPAYWPETIRALVIHGASWTPEMLRLIPKRDIKTEHKRALLRTFGHGRIDHSRSIDSAAKRPTLVLQETITPYVEGKGGNATLGNMNLHALPWPEAELEALGEAQVAMKVTLSYFVEPNPSRRGWRSKFRYQSHGLRFAVKGSTETEERFAQRVNLLEREEESPDEEAERESMSDPDGKMWAIGPQVRSRGSLHSDIWKGTAAQLALKSHVAVFPVGGWWKDIAKHSVDVRYSLLVTLEVLGEIEIDLYTPIATDIAIAIAIAAATAIEVGSNQ